MLRGEEVGSRAWVDTGSAPGRSYKCVEKSDLKYPLIHGQGRQVSELPPPRIPLQLPTAEVGAPLCSGCGWCPGVCSKAIGCFSLCPGCLRTTVHLCALLVHLLGLFAVCHITSPLSPGSVTGNTGRLPGPGRPSAQSPGHKHSTQALLALCPTGERATPTPASFNLPRK